MSEFHLTRIASIHRKEKVQSTLGRFSFLLRPCIVALVQLYRVLMALLRTWECIYSNIPEVPILNLIKRTIWCAASKANCCKLFILFPTARSFGCCRILAIFKMEMCKHWNSRAGDFYFNSQLFRFFNFSIFQF